MLKIIFISTCFQSQRDLSPLIAVHMSLSLCVMWVCELILLLQSGSDSLCCSVGAPVTTWEKINSCSQVSESFN